MDWRDAYPSHDREGDNADGIALSGIVRCCRLSCSTGVLLKLVLMHCLLMLIVAVLGWHSVDSILAALSSVEVSMRVLQIKLHVITLFPRFGLRRAI